MIRSRHDDRHRGHQAAGRDRKNGAFGGSFCGHERMTAGGTKSATGGLYVAFRGRLRAAVPVMLLEVREGAVRRGPGGRLWEGETESSGH